MAATDDSDARFSLIELDLPKQAPPAPAPAPAPAPTARPAPVSTLQAATVQLQAATSVEACEQTMRDIAAGPVGKLHREDPLRVELRRVAKARLALLVLALVWRRAFGMLATGIQQRPALVVRPVVAPPVAPTPAPAAEGLSIVSALQGAASEGAANAAGQASGSLRDGTMRGVGFSSAAGYVQALANGTKEPTTSQYLSILRSQYGYTEEQIAGLTIGTIAQSDLPVGQGIQQDHRVTLPDGRKVDAITLAREQRAAATKELQRTADATTGALAQRVGVSADSVTAWWVIGWRGHRSVTRADMIAACGEAPAAKVNSTQLGRTMDALRGTHDASRVESALPVGVKVRWQIGRGKQHAAYVGAEYGKVLAIVDLMNDGTLSYDGDAAICDEVRQEYARLVGEEVLRPGDVTTWLQQLLRDRWGAVADGHDYLVRPEQREAARAFFSKVAKVWGTAWKRGGLDKDGLPMLGRLEDSVANILGAIYQGLIEEVEEQERLWAATVEAAATKAGKPGVRACTTQLERLDGEKIGEGLIARIDTFKGLGEGPLKSLRDRVGALRAQVRAALAEANDPTAERFANLELK